MLVIHQKQRFFTLDFYTHIFNVKLPDFSFKMPINFLYIFSFRDNRQKPPRALESHSLEPELLVICIYY